MSLFLVYIYVAEQKNPHINPYNPVRMNEPFDLCSSLPASRLIAKRYGFSVLRQYPTPAMTLRTPALKGLTESQSTYILWLRRTAWSTPMNNPT